MVRGDDHSAIAIAVRAGSARDCGGQSSARPINWPIDHGQHFDAGLRLSIQLTKLIHFVDQLGAVGSFWTLGNEQ